MTISPIGIVRVGAVALMWYSCTAFAEERHLIFEEADYIYELVFDDSRISEARMQEAAWLSPFVVNRVTPYLMAGSGIDKVFLSWLEICADLPSECKPYDPEVPDAAFMQNAKKNLIQGEEQVDRLLHVALPAALGPVRAYLLEHLMLSLEREKHRYDYLNTGDIAPMRKLLCRECECGATEEALLEQLQTTADPRLKLSLSKLGWLNRVLACEQKTHPPAYPMAAWEGFLKEFGITERRTPIPAP